MLRPAPRTHRHAHSHAHSDPRTRGRVPRPPPLSPSALGASDFLKYLLLLLLFRASSISICRAGFLLPREGQPIPAGAFRSSVSSTGRSGVHRPAPPSAPPVGGAVAAARPPRGAIARPEVARGCPRKPPRAPRAPPGSPGWASVAWASPLSPAAGVREVYFVLVAGRPARGELSAPPPHSPVPTWRAGEMWYLRGSRAGGSGDCVGVLESRPDRAAGRSGLGTGKGRAVGFPSLSPPRFSRRLHPESLGFGLGCVLPAGYGVPSFRARPGEDHRTSSPVWGG